MLNTLNTTVNYILTHKTQFVIASTVTTVALGVFVFDKKFTISLLPNNPTN